MAYENNKHISILQPIKPMPRSPQFYLLSGFALGVLSVGSVLLGYSYYQNNKAITAAQMIEANQQITDSNHAVENEQLIQKVDTPSEQENIQNPEDGFDQNIENMFKVTKPGNSTEAKNQTSPFEAAFNTPEKKTLIQANDKIKSPKPEAQRNQPSVAKSKEIQGSEKNRVNVKTTTQPAVKIEKSVELKTVSTSSQEQPPATTPQESAEVAQS